MITKARSTDLALEGQLRKGVWVSHPNPTFIGLTTFGTSTPAYTWFNASNEAITYELPGVGQNGTCLHQKDRFWIVPSGSSFRRGYESGGLEEITRSDWFLPVYYHGVFAAPSVTIREFEWQAWSSEALDSLLPTFSERNESLVNSVLELKQLSSIFDVWRQLFAKRLGIKELGPLSSITNAHLLISFGWLPFLDDCKRVAGALDNFRKKVRKLQEDANKPLKRHYRRPIDVGTLPGDSTISGVDGYGQWFRKVHWSTKPVYTATLEFSYVMPDMTSMLNQIRGFLDTLGVQLTASIVWNAIPYSFIVDWFFNVGKWISSLRIDNLKIPAVVTAFCHSVKYEWTARYVFHPTDDFDPNEDEIEVARWSRSYYQRLKDIPSTGLVDWQLKLPGWRQILLGGSLVGQKVLRKWQ